MKLFFLKEIQRNNLTIFRLDAITLIHLPDGPTAYFKLTSIKLNHEIQV